MNIRTLPGAKALREWQGGQEDARAFDESGSMLVCFFCHQSSMCCLVPRDRCPDPGCSFRQDPLQAH
eukprot:1436173-Amphidinium_carterae.1